MLDNLNTHVSGQTVNQTSGPVKKKQTAFGIKH